MAINKRNRQLRLSICIAVYNHGEYIKECLDSFIKYENNKLFELVLVNDCSSDNTDLVIKKWIKKNHNFSIKYLTNEKNLGQVKTLSRAVENSSGDLITFMDSDDFLICSSLSQKLKYFDNNEELKIIYSNGVFFKDGKLGNKGFHNYLKTILNKGPRKIEEYLKSNTPLLSISCAVIKKNFFLSIGGFDLSGLSNDWVTNIKVFENINNNNEFCIDYTPSFGYRIHNNNISQNPELQLNLLTQVIEKYCLKDSKNKLITQAIFVTCIRYKLKDNKKCIEYLLKLKDSSSYAYYCIALICCIMPTNVFKLFNNLFRNIKQYFKGKIF